MSGPLSESPLSLKLLAQKMLVDMSKSPQLRDGAFEAAEAVTWLCTYCQQEGISIGFLEQSHRHSFFSRLRLGRSQSADTNGLQIPLPSPLPKPTDKQRPSLSFFQLPKPSLPHPPPLLASSSHTDLGTNSSFFGKKSDISLESHSPSPSFFSKFKSPFARSSVSSTSNGSSTSDGSPQLNPASAPTTNSSKSRRLPKAFDFVEKRSSFSTVNSTNSEISPLQKYGSALAVPLSPHKSSSSVSMHEPHSEEERGSGDIKKGKRGSSEERRSAEQKRLEEKKEDRSKQSFILIEDKALRRPSEDIVDRNAAVRVWREAVQLGFLQSVNKKKFNDNHALFQFNMEALEDEAQDKRSLNSLSTQDMSTSRTRSLSEFTTSDPTPTVFESIRSTEGVSQSHLESVLSFTSRGSATPRGLVDTTVTPENGALSPVLFDYSQLKTFAWPLSADAYVAISLIGTGGFGDVFSACCSTPVGTRLVAVKVMDLEKVDHALPWLMQESKVMAQLSHPNVTEVFCSFVSDTFLWLVMPLARGGSCAQIMKSNAIHGFASLGIISFIMQQVVCGLDYLHSQRLLHRDIKADNILITHDGSVLLADFGCAGLMQEEKQDRELLMIPAGTRDFMSPEMVHGVGYDERTDIWSLGITAMELFMGSAPSSLREAEAMLEPPQPPAETTRASHSRSLSSRSPCSRSSEHLCMLDGHYSRTTRRIRRDEMQAFRDFVDICLSRNANYRPSTQQLLSHPFLSMHGNGVEELVQLVRNVRPVTALASPTEAAPPLPSYLRVNTSRTRSSSVPAAPRKSPTGRNLSLQHKKNSSKDDAYFLYV